MGKSSAMTLPEEVMADGASGLPYHTAIRYRDDTSM
jgi:hypothetical protein